MLKIFVVHKNPKPEHERQPDDPKGYWHRCGVAFKNRDGSINLKLDMFPFLSLQIREDEKKENGSENGSGEDVPF